MGLYIYNQCINGGVYDEYPTISHGGIAFIYFIIHTSSPSFSHEPKDLFIRFIGKP